MNLPDNCPFCGAGVYVMENGKVCRSERWVEFDCCTSIHAVAGSNPSQSPTCKDAERARLAARVAELEAWCKRLEEAGDAMAERIPDDHWEERDQAKWRAAKEAKP